MPTSFQRRRPQYVVAVIVVIGTGLLWRSGLLPLSPSVAKYGGDALWALMVFLGCGVLFPKASALKLALIALGFAWGIEFLQLYHVPWIDSIRGTLPGRLILGSTFNPPDLVAYAVGIALGAVAESASHRTRPQNPR